MHINIFEMLASIAIIILTDVHIFLYPLPDFFEFYDPFSAFQSIIYTKCDSEPSTTQLTFASNCLPAPMTPGRRMRLSIDSALLCASYKYADVLEAARCVSLELKETKLRDRGVKKHFLLNYRSEA